MDEFRFSWFKLTKKDGKADKDRGEIEVSLQFYSKNAATGSVLDLATKKKHTSLSDIKQSLRKKTTEKNSFIESTRKPFDHSGDKLPFGGKARKADKHEAENQVISIFVCY